MERRYQKETGGDFFEKCDREMQRLAADLLAQVNDVPIDADSVIEICAEIIGYAKASKL
jgi:hypothetical protein